MHVRLHISQIISGHPDFQWSLWVKTTPHTCAENFIRILGQRWSLTRSNALSYINDRLFHLLALNITSSLIDFLFFRRQYQRRNSKRNVRLYFSTFISCMMLVPVCRLLLWISFWHRQHNDYCFMSARWKVGLLASFPCKINTTESGLRISYKQREFKWGLSINKWSDVKWSDVNWLNLCNVILFWSEVHWSELRWSSQGQKYHVR